MQPVFVVSKKSVIKIIEQKSEDVQLPLRLDWGTVNHPSNLLNAIEALPIKQEPDLVDLNKVAQCIQNFHTSKMIGNANKMLNRIWKMIKFQRVQI